MPGLLRCCRLAGCWSNRLFEVRAIRDIQGGDLVVAAVEEHQLRAMGNVEGLQLVAAAVEAGQGCAVSEIEGLELIAVAQKSRQIGASSKIKIISRALVFQPAFGVSTVCVAVPPACFRFNALYVLGRISLGWLRDCFGQRSAQAAQVQRVTIPSRMTLALIVLMPLPSFSNGRIDRLWMGKDDFVRQWSPMRPTRLLGVCGFRNHEGSACSRHA